MDDVLYKIQMRFCMKFKYRYDNLNKLVCFVFGYVHFHRNIPTFYGVDDFKFSKHSGNAYSPKKGVMLRYYGVI